MAAAPPISAAPEGSTVTKYHKQTLLFATSGTFHDYNQSTIYLSQLSGWVDCWTPRKGKFLR